MVNPTEDSMYAPTPPDAPVTVKQVLYVRRQIADDVAEQLNGLKAQISQEVDGKDVIRQSSEDKRANRRNRNRAYTLLVALAFTFLVPVALTAFGMVGLLKFATGISIVPDAAITAWAWIKKY